MPRLLDYDNRETVISGTLYAPSQVRVGDKIFILEKSPNHQKYKNAYIVGKGTLLSIFETEFQGWMFKAKGNFSMVREGHYIAVERQSQNRTEALALFQRGVREQEKENLQKAFALFKESLQNDSQKAETYLALAQVSEKLGLEKEANVYLQEAWDMVSKFSDLSLAITLPVRYLPMRLRLASEQKSTQQRLASYVIILKQLKIYGDKISYYNVANPLNDYSNTVDALLFYYQGLLYENIFYLLSRHPLATVFEWLNDEQRTILLRQIVVPDFSSGGSGKNKAYEQPAKSWDKAYFMAALAYYRLAHELNSNESLAAYHLASLAYYKLKHFPLPKEKEFFTEMLMFYGDEVLRLPSPPTQTTQVRQMQEDIKNGL